ncbi:hypothetical protein L3Y34_012692 [Caenorhabditis briggsae]|uniref:Uncharacterized protein n=1 Tax=Caenorhabditis briggsae TaxID=6238 RepID=A0AAE9CW75_CAEBR|nr:hypothetical protein L3Y34_012692 [Caenorhabditis briggsae]
MVIHKQRDERSSRINGQSYVDPVKLRTSREADDFSTSAGIVVNDIGMNIKWISKDIAVFGGSSFGSRTEVGDFRLEDPTFKEL